MKKKISKSKAEQASQKARKNIANPSEEQPEQPINIFWEDKFISSTLNFNIIMITTVLIIGLVIYLLK